MRATTKVLRRWRRAFQISIGSVEYGRERNADCIVRTGRRTMLLGRAFATVLPPMAFL
ncbi:hypothetical protein D9M71_714610 [compost metagenome]